MKKDVVKDQCDQIGRFLKVVGANLVTKIAKYLAKLLGHCEK